MSFRVVFVFNKMVSSTDPFHVVFDTQVHHKFRAGIDFRTFPPSMPKTKSQKSAAAAPGPAFKGRETYTSSGKAMPAKSQDAPSRATRSNNVPAPASQALSAPEASQASASTDSLPPKKRNPLAGPTHIEPSNPIASQVRAYRRADDHLNIVEGVLESIQTWEEGKIRHHDRQSTTKAILAMYYTLSDVVQGGFRASLGEHVRKLKQKWKALAAECDALSLAAKLEESWSKDDENAWVCLAGMRNAVKKENEWKVPRPDMSRLALKEGGKEEGKVGVPVGMVDEEEEEGEEDENAYNKAMELANLLFPARDATQNLGEASTAEEAEELVEGVVARIQAGDAALWAGSECDPFAALDMLKSTGKLMRNVVTYEHDLRDSKRLLVLIPALQGARPQTFTRHMIQAKVGREGGKEERDIAWSVDPVDELKIRWDHSVMGHASGLTALPPSLHSSFPPSLPSFLPPSLPRHLPSPGGATDCQRLQQGRMGLGGTRQGPAGLCRVEVSGASAVGGGAGPESGVFGAGGGAGRRTRIRVLGRGRMGESTAGVAGDDRGAGEQKERSERGRAPDHVGGGGGRGGSAAGGGGRGRGGERGGGRGGGREEGPGARTLRGRGDGGGGNCAESGLGLQESGGRRDDGASLVQGRGRRGETGAGACDDGAGQETATAVELDGYGVKEAAPRPGPLRAASLIDLGQGEGVR